MPNGTIFAGATASINNTSMQATIRNIAKNAANISILTQFMIVPVTSHSHSPALDFCAEY